MITVVDSGKPGWAVRCLFAVGVAVCLAVASPAPAGEELPLRERFFREAPEGWKRYQEFWLTLEGTSSGVRRVKRDGTWLDVPGRHFWKQCNGNTLDQVATFDSGSWGGRIRGENSAYVFALVRDQDTKPWVIQNIRKKGENSNPTFEDRKTLAPGLILGDVTPSFPEVFHADGFEVVDIAPEADGGAELVQVTFTVPLKGESIRLTGGRLLLDPSSDWIIRRGELEWDFGANMDGRKTCTLRTDYKMGSDHHPLVTRATSKCVVRDNKSIIGEIETSADFDLHQRKNIPESEFTLSAYGFPEPFLAPPKQTPGYLWLGLAGVICLLLAVVAWRKRRQAA